MEKNKMMVLCLMAVLAFSTSNVAGKSCIYRLTDDSYILEGDELAPVTGVEACMAYCTSIEDCQGFDFNPFPNNQCWWFKTQCGLISSAGTGIQHYDKICQVIMDVVSSPGNPNCFNTNYQGPVSDLWSAPNGVTWNFQIAHFGFDWPQTGVAHLDLPLSSLVVFIEEISFKSSDNLDYFRVVITQNNGNNITTQAIGPNDFSTTLIGANDVKRVDFYLAPVDFKRNVSLNDISLKACAGIGPMRECTIFNLVKDQIQATSRGIIRPGGTSGTFSASVAPEYPFVDLDLNCAGVGTVGFSEVIFNGAQDFNYVVISVWDEEAAVPIVNTDCVDRDTFSNAQDIKFASSVRGNRIRSTIIPSAVPNQGILGSIRFSKYSILVV